MTELPAEQEQLVEKIGSGTHGTHGREGARARLDALLAGELTASLGQRGSELVQTRKQMAASLVAASKHQRALVVWTAVLSVATIAYAAAALLPLFWHTDHTWVLWGPRIDNVSGSREGGLVSIDALPSKNACLNLRDISGERWVEAEAGTPVGEICLKVGVSEQSFYRWKKRFGALGVSELRELRADGLRVTRG
jgi:hypothetical protein